MSGVRTVVVHTGTDSSAGGRWQPSGGQIWAAPGRASHCLWADRCAPFGWPLLRSLVSTAWVQGGHATSCRASASALFHRWQRRRLEDVESRGERRLRLPLPRGHAGPHAWSTLFGVTAVASLLVVIVISLMVTRMATIALTATGLSRESARFQARSAFSGAGFTTSESEAVVRHPGAPPGDHGPDAARQRRHRGGRRVHHPDRPHTRGRCQSHPAFRRTRGRDRVDLGRLQQPLGRSSRSLVSPSKRWAVGPTSMCATTRRFCTWATTTS